jgi:hypothetical protein
MTQYDVSVRGALANIAHSQGFRAAANQGGNTFVKERSSVSSIKQKPLHSSVSAAGAGRYCSHSKGIGG